MIADEVTEIAVLVVALATVIDSCAVAVTGFVSLSVTATVNVKVPCFVGVPLMVPESLSSAKPSGSAPIVTAQVIGPVPPVAASAVDGYAVPTVPSASDCVPTASGATGVLTPTTTAGEFEPLVDRSPE
jgi:hypothetical protein